MVTRAAFDLGHLMRRMAFSSPCSVLGPLHACLEFPREAFGDLALPHPPSHPVPV